MNAVRPLQWCLIALMLLAGVGPASAGAPAAPAARGTTKTPEVLVKGGNYTFAAAPSLSPVYTYWVSIAKAVKTVYPKFNITVTETTGALDITKRVRASDGLGNSMADLDYTSSLGEEQFQGQPNKKMRILWYYDFLHRPVGRGQILGDQVHRGVDRPRLQSRRSRRRHRPVTKKIFEMFGVKPKYFEATQQSAIEAVGSRQFVGLSKTGPVPDSFFQQIMPSVELESSARQRSSRPRRSRSTPTGCRTPFPPKRTGTPRSPTVAVLTGGQTTSDLPEEVDMPSSRRCGRQAAVAAGLPSAANNNVIELTSGRRSAPRRSGALLYRARRPGSGSFESAEYKR